MEDGLTGTKKWLTTSDDPSHRLIIGRWATISDDWLVDGETPLEDYKFWIITDAEISEEEAWDHWMKELAETWAGWGWHD